MTKLSVRVVTVLMVDESGNVLSLAKRFLLREGKPKMQVIIGDQPSTLRHSAPKGILEFEVSCPPEFRLRREVSAEEGNLKVVIPNAK